MCVFVPEKKSYYLAACFESRRALMCLSLSLLSQINKTHAHAHTHWAAYLAETQITRTSRKGALSPDINFLRSKVTLSGAKSNSYRQKKTDRQITGRLTHVCHRCLTMHAPTNMFQSGITQAVCFCQMFKRFHGHRRSRVFSHFLLLLNIMTV